MASPIELGRGVILGIGGLQLLVNGLLLWRGWRRLPAAEAGESLRVAELLRVAWAYGMLANAGIGLALVLLAGGWASGEPLACQAVRLIGGYYLVLGVVCNGFTGWRRPGFLVFSGLGCGLLGIGWLS